MSVESQANGSLNMSGAPHTDHQGVFMPYVAAEEAHTLDGIVTNKEEEIKSRFIASYIGAELTYFSAEWSEEWKSRGTGLMANKSVTTSST